MLENLQEKMQLYCRTPGKEEKNYRGISRLSTFYKYYQI